MPAVPSRPVVVREPAGVRRAASSLRRPILGAALATMLLTAVPSTGASASAPVGAPVGAAASASAGHVHVGKDPTLVRTTLGPVVGRDEGRSSRTYSWLGIPYAEPPVGDLRWRATKPHRTWTEVRPARQYGSGCAQPGRFFSPSPNGPFYDLAVRDGLRQPVGAEDCLTLNVFRPATAARDLPVVFFVHGGSNVVGYSADPMYDGRELARRAQAVVVTVNYRVGVFGWLNAGGSGEPRSDAGGSGERGSDAGGSGGHDPLAASGNFGTLDLIEALRFVDRNARRFGADPDNISVMGQSAGAVNVWSLLVSPLARGMVDKAIPLSGGLSTRSVADARAYADRVVRAAATEYPTSGLGGMDLLRSLPADDLVRVLVKHQLDATPAVIADGTVIPSDPYAVLASGVGRNVPVLAGNTLEEGKLFGSSIGAHRPSDYDRFTLQYLFDPDHPGKLTAADLLTDEYLPVDGPGGWNDAAATLTELVFTGINRDSLDALARSGNRSLYHYRFDWNQQPAPFDQVYGAVHAIDLPFVFGNFDRNVFSYAFSRRNQPGRLRLSELMIASIRNFVHRGSPQHRGLGRSWEQWPASLVLDADDRRVRLGSTTDR
ncbi:carboxylesterase family protein [Micromonospora sp. WMMD1102]|uniref:carboxylesterase/lipase family protein n=1 Tax=Micromonospora sp. WMMD1102 TaxID=3016105 RepID=UPI002414EF83|nr:carboxylesterase family protein [Micromonospora sp. WMMD1102]MDG4787813.1 carboxylesterase family protein [Micromonospora sp. WMMD1102]